MNICGSFQLILSSLSRSIAYRIRDLLLLVYAIWTHQRAMRNELFRSCQYSARSVFTMKKAFAGKPDRIR